MIKCIEISTNFSLKPELLLDSGGWGVFASLCSFSRIDSTFDLKGPKHEEESDTIVCELTWWAKPKFSIVAYLIGMLTCKPVVAPNLYSLKLEMSYSKMACKDLKNRI